MQLEPTVRRSTGNLKNIPKKNANKKAYDTFIVTSGLCAIPPLLNLSIYLSIFQPLWTRTMPFNNCCQASVITSNTRKWVSCCQNLNKLTVASPKPTERPKAPGPTNFWRALPWPDYFFQKSSIQIRRPTLNSHGWWLWTKKTFICMHWWLLQTNKCWSAGFTDGCRQNKCSSTAIIDGCGQSKCWSAAMNDGCRQNKYWSAAIFDGCGQSKWMMVADITNVRPQPSLMVADKANVGPQPWLMVADKTNGRLQPSWMVADRQMLVRSHHGWLRTKQMFVRSHHWWLRTHNSFWEMKWQKMSASVKKWEMDSKNGNGSPLWCFTICCLGGKCSWNRGI